MGQSTRQQLNVRLDPGASALWVELVPRVQEAFGITLSQSQIVALALQALSEKYPSARVPEEQPAPAPAPKASKAPARKRSG